MKTPIALFTYSRPDHTDRLLDSLSHCTRLDECDLYIYCDGLRKPEHGAGVEASRQVVRKWTAQLGATVIERTENLGLARSIVTGVTELCDRYGRVVVLEDDLVLSPDFVNYMLQSLDRYQDEPLVYQISGYMFSVNHPAKPDAFLLPLTTTWGWATWKRAWKAFNWDVPDAPDRLANADFRRRFDLDDSYPYSAMLEQRLAGENDSWGILWWYVVFCLGGLALHPRVSLVQNLGFDGTGVHSGVSDQGVAASGIPGRLPESLSFSAGIQSNESAFERVKMFLRVPPPQKQRKPSVVARVRYRIRRLFPRIEY